MLHDAIVFRRNFEKLLKALLLLPFKVFNLLLEKFPGWTKEVTGRRSQTERSKVTGSKVAGRNSLKTFDLLQFQPANFDA